MVAKSRFYPQHVPCGQRQDGGVTCTFIFPSRPIPEGGDVGTGAISVQVKVAGTTRDKTRCHGGPHEEVVAVLWRGENARVGVEPWSFVGQNSVVYDGLVAVVGQTVW